jgi:hypothetical protein
MIRGTASLGLALVLAAVLFASPCVACLAPVPATSNSCCNHHSPCQTVRTSTADSVLAKLISQVQVPLPELSAEHLDPPAGVSLRIPRFVDGPQLPQSARPLTPQLNI